MTDKPDEPEEDGAPPEMSPPPPAPEAAKPPPPAAASPPAEPSPPPVPAPPAPPVLRQPEAWAPAPQPASPRLPWVPIVAVIGVLLVLGLGAFAWRALSGNGEEESAYVVQSYTPATELITARDRVQAYAEPDAASGVVVIFGQGVTLNVTGRTSRGLGGDWYAISWNGRTAFVRQQDVAAGSGAPPAPIVREREQREEPEPEERKRDDLVQEERVAEVAPATGALSIGDVGWIREPNARDFARFYPSRALDNGVSGRVTLDCVIGGSGRLDCSVASETPSGHGFGQAALSISRQLRVRSTLPDGSSASGRHMMLPLSFRSG